MVDSVDGLVTNCRNARKYRGGWKVLRRRRKKEENGKCFLTGKCYRVKLILFFFKPRFSFNRSCLQFRLQYCSIKRHLKRLAKAPRKHVNKPRLSSFSGATNSSRSAMLQLCSTRKPTVTRSNGALQTQRNGA